MIIYPGFLNIGGVVSSKPQGRQQEMHALQAWCWLVEVYDELTVDEHSRFSGSSATSKLKTSA